MIAADELELTSINTSSCATRASSSWSRAYCLAACTIVLGAIPRDKICVTSNAKLGFQDSWDLDANGKRVTNQEATRLLYSIYPSAVRNWIAQHGGMTAHMIWLQGKELQALYRTCSVGD